MRIDAKAKIANIPILKVRDFLKRYCNNDLLLRSTFSYGFNISDRKSSDLIKKLVSLGYIESAGTLQRKKVWKKTLKGSTFSLASAAKPILRQTAEKHLALFLDRVKFINDSPDFLLKIRKVEIFGSYLSEVERLNDVDVAVEIIWKEDHPCVRGKDKSKVALQHAEKAIKNGRHFGIYFELLTWPETQVLLYLKSKSRVISLHSIDDEILNIAEKKTLFET
jgi:hypothetical protein